MNNKQLIEFTTPDEIIRDDTSKLKNIFYYMLL